MPNLRLKDTEPAALPSFPGEGAIAMANK